MAGKLEIEAKFKIADRDTFSAFLAKEELGSFELKLAPTYQVEDVYQDTAENHLARAGYACRVRRRGGTWLVSLKEQGETDDMIHERTEFESPLPYFELDPLRWPDSEARQLAIQLSGGATLRRLFTIHQIRHTRIVTDQEKQVAELSLDEVRLEVPGHPKTYFELELEQLAEGAAKEFRQISSMLKEEWSLEPQTESKFLVAMSLLNRGADKGDNAPLRLSGARLLPADRSILEHITEHAQTIYARRAQLLLDWDAGADIQSLRNTSGYSRSSVYHWLHAYQTDRLHVFPKQILAEAAASAVLAAETQPDQLDRMDEGTLLAPEPAEAKPVSSSMRRLEDLYRRYDVDMAHAHHVASLALELFSASHKFHGLPKSCRRLLELGGMLHNLGMSIDPERHHTAGRDALLEAPVQELSDEERLMIAAMIVLHRKRMTRKKLEKKAVLAVPQRRRPEALNLAALIRIADGLDYSQSQLTRIVETNVTPAVIEVVLEGPYAVQDAARAENKTDLWNLLHPVRFYFRVRNSSSAVSTATPTKKNASNKEEADSSSAGNEELPLDASFEPPPELDLLVGWVQEAPGVLADDMMSEAGRKLFRFHLHKMLLHEAGTKKGEDIEELHDMRVAIRRLRSASRLVRGFFVPKEAAPLIEGLRRTGRVLGAVRDLDVLLDKAIQYQQTLPPEQQNGLDLLLVSWRAQRESARQEMIAYLNGRDYRQFVRQFTAFVTTEGAGALPFDPNRLRPCRVRHVVPRLIYAHLEAVRAYEDWLAAPSLECLHALRIECKQLRYALEFFREVLGPEAGAVIKEVTTLQDHLGELHDADVADHLLRDFLDGGAGSLQPLVTRKKQQAPPRQRVMAPGVALYLAERQAALQKLAQTFPKAWENFNRLEVRQNLATSISVL